MTPVVLGISGPSGSGKSTVANAVRDRVPSSIVLQQDWYFKDTIDCPPDANFCDFRWLDIDQFVMDLRSLIEGVAVAVPAVDFMTFERVGTQILQPTPVILVEGMTIFRINELGRCFDLKYYIESDFETLAERKRVRDRTERQKTADVIEAQLRWIAEEYRRDARLRARTDVVLLKSGTPVHQVAEHIAGDLLQMLSGRGFGSTNIDRDAQRRPDSSAPGRN
jgi:uridine kinase